MPFSQTYPLCCIDIRNYVDQFYQFVESLGRPSQETDETAKKVILTPQKGLVKGTRQMLWLTSTTQILDRILTRRISFKIRERVKTATNISQLSLVMVNLLFFETACCELEILLSSLKDTHLGSSPNGPGSVTELESVASFRETLETTSSRMVDLIAFKTDSFFELAEYQWTPTSMPNQQIEEQPSSYLTEMVDYLTLVMDSVLVQLPDVLKDGVYRRALQHVADVMMVRLFCAASVSLNESLNVFFCRVSLLNLTPQK